MTSIPQTHSLSPQGSSIGRPLPRLNIQQERLLKIFLQSVFGGTDTEAQGKVLRARRLGLHDQGDFMPRISEYIFSIYAC